MKTDLIRQFLESPSSSDEEESSSNPPQNQVAQRSTGRVERIPRKRIEAATLDEVADHCSELFDNLNMSSGKVIRTPGKIRITGRTAQNDVINFSKQESGNYQSKTTSSYRPSTSQERQKTAKQLRKAGLTQEQIANELGVSQKTISNDLKQ